jgi:hypothetical protein
MILCRLLPTVKGLDHQPVAYVFALDKLKIIQKLNWHENIRIVDCFRDACNDPTLDFVLKAFKNSGTANYEKIAIYPFGALDYLFHGMTENYSVRQIGNV